MNRIEESVVALLLRTPAESCTIMAISTLLKEYYSYVYETLKILKKRKIITIEKAGKSSVCKINFSTSPADLLVIASLKNKSDVLKKNPDISLITEKIEQSLAKQLYIMFLFGSRAKGTAKETSDTDLFFIVQNKNDVEKFKQKAIGALSDINYNVHITVSTAEWFYGMLNKKNSVGREVFENSIVLHGADLYYNLVKKYDTEKP